MEKTQRLFERSAMKIFDHLYPEAPELHRRIYKSACESHRVEWLESHSLHEHYKINQQEIDKEIDKMLKVKFPLIISRQFKEGRSIQLSDFGRTIKK
jgi:hypothetical protein